MADALVLHVEAFWVSPWVCTAYAALRAKQLPFETSIGMYRPGTGAVETMLDRALTGTAPVLQHQSLWIAESLAIVEYLEDAFPAPMWPRVLPADIRERARARQVLSWLRSGLDPLYRERPTELVIYHASAGQRPPLTAAAARAADHLVRVAQRLGAGPSGALFGDPLGIVDVDLAFALMRLIRAGQPVPEALAAYAAAVWARPSVREFIEHPRPPYSPLAGVAT